MNPKYRETKKVSKVAGQFLKVALIFSILGKILLRDLYILKSILIEETRVRHSKQVSSLGGWGMVLMKDF
jgi:hypothetical protein